MKKSIKLFRSNKAVISIFLVVLATMVGSAKAETFATDSLIADTIRVESFTTFGSGMAVIPVNFFNDESLAGIEITLSWSSSLLTLDSVSFQGSRIDYISVKGYSIDSTNQTVVMFALPFQEALVVAGSGRFSRLYFSFGVPIIPQTIMVDSITLIAGNKRHGNLFSDVTANQFKPQFVTGTLTIQENCCIGDRGNFDSSAGELSDISDLTALIDYIFRAGNPTLCPEEGNINGSIDGQIDISDITFLISYLFSQGSPPPACP